MPNPITCQRDLSQPIMSTVLWVDSDFFQNKRRRGAGYVRIEIYNRRHYSDVEVHKNGSSQYMFQNLEDLFQSAFN